MNRIFWTVTAVLLAASLTAIAEDDDMIMGNYQGKFTSDGWADRYIRAQVVAQSKTAHRVVLFIGENETAAKRLEMEGRSKDGNASFKGALALPALGGSFEFAAKIENETLRGTLKEGREEAALRLRVVLDAGQ